MQHISGISQLTFDILHQKFKKNQLHTTKHAHYWTQKLHTKQLDTYILTQTNSKTQSF
jgi:hypothetical protein